MTLAAHAEADGVAPAAPNRRPRATCAAPVMVGPRPRQDVVGPGLLQGVFPKVTPMETPPITPGTPGLGGAPVEVQTGPPIRRHTVGATAVRRVTADAPRPGP